jgi:hypothetical protein
LDAAIPAGVLPDGEIVRSIASYLGFVLIGTDNGVRFAVADSNGDLTIGALLETGTKVECFEGQGSFVWFGWRNYDGTDTGLGRLSLEEFASSDGLAPAYASDLMAVAQGAVTSVVTFGSRRYFAVSGVGVWGQDTALVASGMLESGRIDYGIVEEKVALEVDVLHEGPHDHTVAVRSNDATWIDLGGHPDAGAYSTNTMRGQWFEVRVTLARDSGDTTTGPTISAVTLSTRPSVPATGMIYAPIVVHETVTTLEGTERAVDTEALLATIDGLLESRAVATWQEGNVISQVTVENREFRVWRIADSGCREGTSMVQLKEV